MELRVQLKVCEGCGCLWYRNQEQRSVYCKPCETKLESFPAPRPRVEQGRRKRREPLMKVWAASEGGIQ